MRRAWHADESARPWYTFGVHLVAVCRNVEAAAVMLGGGARVVLCWPDAAALGDAVASLRAAGFEPPGHRLAALVGDPSEPEGEAAAQTMARELFGGEPVLVLTANTARDLAAKAARDLAYQAPNDPASAPRSEESETGSLQGPEQARSDTV